MGAALKLLDELEDQGGEYRRIEAVAYLDGGAVLPVWLYVYANPRNLAGAGGIAVKGQVWRPEDFLS
jgi:gamma-glutamylcyclotransferase (GGCT)/AIG2-like uncharacterized protein YtfP